MYNLVSNLNLCAIKNNFILHLSNPHIVTNMHEYIDILQDINIAI